MLKWESWESAYTLTLSTKEFDKTFLIRHYADGVDYLIRVEAPRNEKFDNIRAIEDVTTEMMRRGSSKRKSFGDYSERQKKRIKEKIMLACNDSILMLRQSYGILPVELDIINLFTNKVEIIPLIDDGVTVERDKCSYFNILLLMKDKFRISDGPYKELSSMIEPSLPIFHELTKARNNFDDIVNIMSTPGTTERCSNFLQT